MSTSNNKLVDSVIRSIKSLLIRRKLFLGLIILVWIIISIVFIIMGWISLTYNITWLSKIIFWNARDWIDISLEPLATFIAVYIAFYLDTYYEKQNYYKEVYKIVPLIEIELRKNLLLIEDWNKRRSQNLGLDITKKFTCEYWGIYKIDLKDWGPVNIIPLKEIYGLMEDTNLNREKGYIDYDAATEIGNKIKKLIEQQLNEYKKWYSYSKNTVARKQKRDTIKQYKKLDLSKDIDDVLLYMENELDEIEKTLATTN